MNTIQEPGFLGRMPKVGKILLGLGTAWPICFLFLVVPAIMMATLAIGLGTDFPEKDSKFLQTTQWILPAGGGATFLWGLFLTILYVMDATRNQRLTREQRAIWTAILLVGNIIAIPVYWFVHVLRSPQSSI